MAPNANRYSSSSSVCTARAHPQATFPSSTSIERFVNLEPMNPNQNPRVRRHRSDETHDTRPFNPRNREGRFRSTEIGPEFHKQDLHQAEFYDDLTPAVPIVNLPEHTRDLMNDNWVPKPFRYEIYSAKQNRPKVGEVTKVYPKLKTAMEETGWAICKRFLGAGSFGFVYLGFRLSEINLPMDQRHLAAVKQVYHYPSDKPIVNVMKQPRPPGHPPPGPFANHAIRDDCFLEIEILERLKHQNIVRMLTHFAVDRTRSVHVVLEYCDNRDLCGELMLQPEQRFPIPVARYYFKQLIDGLAYMHDLYVAHCDLKLENILVKIHPNGRDKVLKIADFGNAMIFRRVNTTTGEPKYIGGTVNRGTYPYQPPEVLAYRFRRETNIEALLKKPYRPFPISPEDKRAGITAASVEPPPDQRRKIIPLPVYFGKRPYHYPAVDVYCSGVVLYMMITGAMPYHPRKWPDALDYVFRCQPYTFLSLMGQETWDFIRLLLEPITDRNSVSAEIVPNVRPTATQVKTMAWMNGEAVPNEVYQRQLDEFQQRFVPPISSPPPPPQDPSSPPADQPSRKRQRSPTPEPVFDPNVPGPSSGQPAATRLRPAPK